MTLCIKDEHVIHEFMVNFSVSGPYIFWKKLLHVKWSRFVSRNLHRINKQLIIIIYLTVMCNELILDNVVNATLN